MKEVSKQDILNALEPMLDCQANVSVMVCAKDNNGTKVIEVLWFDNRTNDLVSSVRIYEQSNIDDLFDYIVEQKYFYDYFDYRLDALINKNAEYNWNIGRNYYGGFKNISKIEIVLKSYTEYLVKALN